MKSDKIKTMEEFASVIGISRPTVSKYFNDPSSVRRSTRKRIEEALEVHNYTPNIYAINQNRQATRNIGIVVPYLADPFFAEIARKLEIQCSTAGFRPILLSSHGRPEQEVANLESLRSIKPAAVLLAPLGRRSFVAEIEEFCNDVKTVMFDCDIEGVAEAYVGTDHFQSMGMMVDYLCNTGEPPAFFEMLDAPNPNTNKHRSAYETAMRARGHSPWILKVEGEGWDFEEIGFVEGARMIRQRRLPSNTLLCSNDRLAIGFLAAAYEAGLRVGSGTGCALRVAGHDDHPFARFTCPALTTISQNYQDITETAMQMALTLINSEERPSGKDVTLYDGSLIIRHSA